MDKNLAEEGKTFCFSPNLSVNLGTKQWSLTIRSLSVCQVFSRKPSSTTSRLWCGWLKKGYGTTRTGHLRYRIQTRTMWAGQTTENRIHLFTRLVLIQPKIAFFFFVCVFGSLMLLCVCVLLSCPSGPREACVPGTTVPRGGTHTDGLNHVGRLEVWAGAENTAFFFVFLLLSGFSLCFSGFKAPVLRKKQHVKSLNSKIFITKSQQIVL